MPSGTERNAPGTSRFKVHRYPPDYPAINGRDLTPQGVIELPPSQTGETGLDQPAAVAIIHLTTGAIR